MKSDIKEYIRNNRSRLYGTLKELCAIPAPSHLEEKRAEYCKKWLEDAGAGGVYIDEALNVIFPYNCEGSNDITVFAAHTDTVFPDTEPMPYFDDGERIHCPGAADDTASVTVLLMMAEFFVKNNISTDGGILFVCNSCEEGLGDLLGTKQLFKDYRGRIGRFITFDSNYHTVSDRCVGSHRYEVEVKTQGGHSFGNFGRKNAIAELSSIVSEIYKLQVPNKDGTRTTYNVGAIQGGTSVNSIAQSAKMLCEYRSDDIECLDYMKARFESLFSSANTEDVLVSVKLVGDRPCGNIDKELMDRFKLKVIPTIEGTIGQAVSCESSSTDCNIPLSLGIPALCVGVDLHSGIHTREEWVDKASLLTGLEIAIKLGLTLSKTQS